jgi:hypothetical protein
LDIITKGIDIIKEYLSFHQNNNTLLNINDFLDLIDKLEFVERIDITKFLKYNPNII